MNRKKILIVDDNRIVLKALSMKLAARNYLPLTAEDGSAAIGVVRKEKPDLILLDLSFPPDVAHGGMGAWDGFLIMDWLRRTDDGRNTPFIIITGSNVIEDKERALASGALSFFHKPIDSEELLAAISQALEEKPGEKPAPAPGLI